MSARNLLTSLLVASSVVQGAPPLQREGDVTVLAHGPAGLRNRHLRESLEVDKFPDATLRVMRADLKFPKEGSPVESQVTGELTLHGRSRPVPVHYRAERRPGGPTQIAGSLQLDMRDFQIVPPSYLGVGVSPDVEVDIELTVDGL